MVARSTPLLLATGLGCGRIGFGAATDGAAPDGCVLGPWSPPVLIQGVASPQTDFGPSLSPDLSRLVFSSDRSSNLELYVADRVDEITYTAPTAIAALDTPSEERAPVFSCAGDELYFSSNRTGAYRLYVSSYAGGLFGAASTAIGLESVVAQGPTLSCDGLELFYVDASLRTVRATRAMAGAPWVTEGPVIEINSGTFDGWGSLSRDGLTFYYMTGRVDTGDIWVATRSQIGAPFTNVLPVTELDTPQLEGDPALSLDGKVMVLSSDRDGNRRNYITTRSCQ